MQLGGNNGLSEFLASYDLMSEPMDVRYQTKAAEYYRKKLKAFSNDEEFNEEKPDYEEGRMPIEYKVKTQEELKQSIGGSGGFGSDEPNEFWENTKSATVKGFNYVGKGFSKMGDKIKETGVTDKISTGAKTVGTKTAEYSSIAYNKTKEGINKIVTNEKVQEYGTKAKEGAKQVGKSVWGFFSSTYDKITNADSDNQNNEQQEDPNDEIVESNPDVPIVKDENTE